MLYAVISDTHDNYYNLEQAIKIILKRGINTCFHLGDFCAPGIVRAMVAHQSLNWICIWGNVDGAKVKVILEQKNNPRFDVSAESFRELDLPEGKIFLVHFPLLAQHAAKSGDYQAVFYGHNHTKKVDILSNSILLANPGELSGVKFGQPSFGIWDSTANKIELVDLTDFRVAK